MSPPYPLPTEGGKKVSPRCTRKSIAHRVGTAGHSSISGTGLRTISGYRECSKKNYRTSLRRSKKQSAMRLTVILTVLLLVGVMAVIVMRVTTPPSGSSAIHASGEGGSSSSTSSMSHLPNTGGP
jgi:uncharacterized BrkB/YihY/UPF0761 family membrane protein